MINLWWTDLNCIVSTSLLVKNAKIYIIPIKRNGAVISTAPFILLSEIYNNIYNNIY
jgi:hypothetical protein